MPNTPLSSLNRQNVKKYMFQGLQSIAKFIGGLGVLFLLFFVFIIAFARGFRELNPDEYHILKAGLLFLLFFLIAIPIRFRVPPFPETFQRIFRRIPSFTQAQLLRFAWLAAKIVLWGIASVFIMLWVGHALEPEVIDPQGYIDLWSDLELLLYVSAVFVSIRLIVLHFYPQFSYSTLMKNIGKFLAKRNIPPFFAITSFILLILSVSVIGNFFLGNQKSTLYWSRNGYNAGGSSGRLTINKFFPDQNRLSAKFFLNPTPTDGETLSKSGGLIFEGKNLPINEENYVYSDVDVEISGNDYYFPFNEYEVEFLTFYPATGHFEDFVDFQVTSNLNSIVLVKNYEISSSVSAYSFFIRYSSYFKLLVMTIGIAFIGFFVAITMAKSRNQIVELSIGTFAALIAIRGFLIPSNISSPILIDQIFLLYIILLLVVFLLKINQLKWEQ
jgi:hypothetical protein